MRKALSTLGAVAFVTIGFAITVTPATAACVKTPTGAQLPVVAKPLPTSPGPRNVELNKINEWPRVAVRDSNPPISHLEYCGSATPSTDGSFTIVWQAAQKIAGKGTNVPPTALANKWYLEGARVYFYDNLADLNAHWGSNVQPPVPGGEITGVTKSPETTATNTNILNGDVGILRSASDGYEYEPNTLKGTTYHELGHSFDELNSRPSITPGSNFEIKFLADQTALNAQTTAQAFGSITIPTACAGKPNNWEIAKCIWPFHTTNREFFANIFGMRLGTIAGDATDEPETVQFANWMIAKFPQTKLYIDSIANGGTP